MKALCVVCVYVVSNLENKNKLLELKVFFDSVGIKSDQSEVEFLLFSNFVSWLLRCLEMYQ